MTLGRGGRYEDACTVARESTKARGVVLIVFDGEHGNGFSVQVDAERLLALPEILETIAAQIRADWQRVVS